MNSAAVLYYSANGDQQLHLITNIEFETLCIAGALLHSPRFPKDKPLGVRSTAFGRLLLSCVVNERATHCLGGCRKEVKAILPIRSIIATQPNPRFMHQFRRLQCPPFAAQAVGCNLSQRRIDKFKQLLRGAALAPLYCFKVLSYRSDHEMISIS